MKLTQLLNSHALLLGLFNLIQKLICSLTKESIFNGGGFSRIISVFKRLARWYIHWQGKNRVSKTKHLLEVSKKELSGEPNLWKRRGVNKWRSTIRSPFLKVLCDGVMLICKSPGLYLYVNNQHITFFMLSSCLLICIFRVIRPTWPCQSEYIILHLGPDKMWRGTR